MAGGAGSAEEVLAGSPGPGEPMTEAMEITEDDVIAAFYEGVNEEVWCGSQAVPFWRPCSGATGIADRRRSWCLAYVDRASDGCRILDHGVLRFVRCWDCEVFTFEVLRICRA